MLNTVLKFLLNGPAFFIGLCILMFIFLEIGRFIRLSSSAKKQIAISSSIDGPVEKILFALFGLLIAFTFTGAGARLDAKRQLITVEVNAIGTAYLRIDLLPKEVQPQMRDLFKQYTLLRANTNEDVAEGEASTKSQINSSANLQKQIWNVATNNCTKTGTSIDCTKLVLPALNAMFDITTTRLMARLNHPPIIIYIMLIALSLFSALLVGYDLPQSSRRNLLYMTSYAIIISIVLYLILDMEMPHYGFITIDNADQVLVNMASGM
jgi:hypothetical protein